MLILKLLSLRLLSVLGVSAFDLSVTEDHRGDAENAE